MDKYGYGITAMQSAFLKKAENYGQRNMFETAERREVKRVSASIHAGKCPTPGCESKLIRGKKDKLNNYKRIWTCPCCFNRYSIPNEKER